MYRGGGAVACASAATFVATSASRSWRRRIKLSFVKAEFGLVIWAFDSSSNVQPPGAPGGRGPARHGLPQKGFLRINGHAERDGTP